MSIKTRKKRSLGSGLGLKVLQNPVQNPKEPGITKIQAGAFTFCYRTFEKNGSPCKPWVHKPEWTYESDRLYGEVLEAYNFIEPKARLLAISVIADHRARLEEKARKEALNPRFPGCP